MISVKYKSAMKRTILYHSLLGLAVIVTTFLCGLNSLYAWQVSVVGQREKDREADRKLYG